MEIEKGIEITDLGLFIKDKKILIISDLHLGQEELIHKRGISFPLDQFKQIKDKVILFLDKLNPKIVVITGDFKHEFGSISSTEWSQISRLIDILKEKSKLIIIKGNHDAILKPIAERKEIDIKDYYKIGDIYICHGDLIPENKDFSTSKTIIIGHEHPSITLQKGPRKEIYRCFLKGKYKNKKLIVMPSLNPISAGSDIFKEKLLSPFLRQNLNNFEIFIVEAKAYYFGKVKDIKKL